MLADVARLVARVAEAPVGVVVATIDGSYRVVASHGLDLDARAAGGDGDDPSERHDLHRAALSIAAGVVAGTSAAVVVDAATDGRATAGLISLGACAHAAAPVVGDGGERIGVVCAIDRRRRPFSELHLDAVTTLAAAVTSELDRRRRAVRLDRLETAHRAETERFFQLADAMPAMVWTVRPDGTVDYVSRAFRDYVGDGLDITRWTEAVHPDDVDAAVEAWRRAWRDHTTYTAEFRFRRHDGAYRWHVLRAEPIGDADGATLAWFGSAIDLHEHRGAELALRENEERFRLLAQATSDVVFDWDLDADSVWYGEGLEQMVGPLSGPVLAMDRIVGRIHPDDRARVTTGLRSVVAGSEELWEDQFRLLHSDGSDVDVEVNGFVIRDSSGRAVRLVGSLVDMTVQRELERQLAQSQRLEAIGQLTGGIAHDFNNLLTVILGNSEMLIEDLADDEEQRELAEMTRTAAIRGAELTRRLLAFARRQPLTPSVVDVGELLHDLHGLLRRSLGEQIEMAVVHDRSTWPALVDRAQLESAVLNVCLNARDAMADGGRLTIEVADAVFDRTYADGHAEVEPGEYVMVAVSDTGEGMPPEVLERAFDPFFTTKAPGRGTGLGLSMVYGFAKQSRGHVVMTSELGTGTRVELYVPRADRPAPSRRPPDPGADAATRGHDELTGGDETILLVEDDELVRTFAASQLRALGYAVVEAADGRAALELVAGGLVVDLLFTDVVMPGGVNGRELADAATEIDRGLRVLFTSGYAESAIVHDGRLDSGVALLPKPYRLDELAGWVRRVLDAGT